MQTVPHVLGLEEGAIATKDYYQILGIKRDASDKDIRQAFRKLARKYHPDLNPSDKAAEASFKEIAEAYEVLSDPEQKAKYDRFGPNWKYAGDTGGGPQGGNRAYAGNIDLDDILSGAGPDLGSLFGNIFNRTAGGRTGRGRMGDTMASAAIEQPITVSLEEAYAGTTRLINLAAGDGTTRRLEVRIPPGVTDGSRIHVSPDAGGRGQRDDIYLVINVQPHVLFERDGDDLTVKVHVPLHVTVLGGEVQVPTPKGTKLALRIPEETQNLKRIRLRGQGMPHLGGTGSGDLFAEVVVTVPTHLNEEEKQLFQRLKDLREGAKVTT